MATVTVTAAAVRAVAHSPEDTLTLDAKSGYTPACGDIVAISGNDECDAADSNSTNIRLKNPIGVVISKRAIRTNAGVAGYKVTVLLRGLVEGFASLSAGFRVFTSTTAGKIETNDPSTGITDARPIGLCINATAIYFSFPAMSVPTDEGLES